MKIIFRMRMLQLIDCIAAFSISVAVEFHLTAVICNDIMYFVYDLMI